MFIGLRLGCSCRRSLRNLADLAWLWILFYRWFRFAQH
jgi:hypothetical protein